MLLQLQHKKRAAVFCVNLWGESLALLMLVELQSSACVGQSFQPLLNTLSPPIFSWREKFEGLLEENNPHCSHFKVKCLVSIGSSAQHIYSTFLLLLRQLIICQNTLGRQVFLSHSTTEEAIPRNIKQLSRGTEEARSRATNHNSQIPLTLHLYCGVLSPSICSIMTLQRRGVFFLMGMKIILF